MGKCIERTSKTLKWSCLQNAIENKKKRDRKRIEAKADTLSSIEPLSIKQIARTVVEKPSSSCYLETFVRATAKEGLFSFSTFYFKHFDPYTSNENTRTNSVSLIAFFIWNQEISTVTKDRMITGTVYISFHDYVQSVSLTFDVVVFIFWNLKKFTTKDTNASQRSTFSLRLFLSK